MKNYVIKFMDKSWLALTAEEATKLAKEWQKGSGLVLIHGNMYATHQICSINRVAPQEEKDLCMIAGIAYANIPTIEKLLKSPNKQLHE